MSNVDHIEVAPRMWDKSIAASYVPSKEKELATDIISEPNATKPTNATQDQVCLTPLDKLKMYLIPALLVIGIMISIYILWKYFTIYRNSKTSKAKPAVICEDEIKRPTTIDPQHLVKTEDLSKYEFDSDEEDAESNDQLSKIEEVSEESDGYEEDEESDSESESSVESDKEVPDISEIQELINESPFDTEEMAILEDHNLFDVPETPAPKTKKNKKSARITV